jgi:hypothetical protein
MINPKKLETTAAIAKSMSFKAATKNPYFISLSEYNKKLVPNKDVRFLIWNIPAKTTCPFATEHCKTFCYAVKSETAYPDVLPSRTKHFIQSQNNDFVVRMVFTIAAYLNRPIFKGAKKIVVRIHESGDFYNVDYMRKWYDIATYFKHDKKVVFMAYTKSVRYVHILATQYGYKKPSNLVIRYSIWDDTNPDDIALATRYNLPIYTAVDEFTPDIKSKNRCRCNDCATCEKCWTGIKKLICEIH